jgi:hypothetical protein
MGHQAEGTVQWLGGRTTDAIRRPRAGMPAEICAVMDELVEVLSKYSARLGLNVEMVIETDGACSIRVEDGGAYSEVVNFPEFAALLRFLQTGEM